MSPQLPFPPGPKGNFLLGSARELARSWPGHSERCAREYGDVVCYRFLHVPICQLTHPDHIEYVLVKNAANFHKSRDYAAFKFFLGNGLLTNEGASWRAQRQLVQPAFRHENIAAYAEIMADSTAAHLSRWKDGEKRDLHQEMGELALDIVAKSLFGANVGHAAETIGKEVSAVMERFFAQAAMSFLLPSKFPIPKTPRLMRSKKRLDEIVLSIIRERQASKTPANDLLQRLLDARDEQGERMNEEQLREEVMTLFIAGHETTANALTWTWYLLSQNPGTEKKLAEELDAVLAGRAPALADLPRLPYTEMVIKESMRLYPPAWGVGRRALEDFEVGGYKVPAGTNVFLLQWVTHRDARFFPEPERFDPERWRDDPIRKGKIPRFAYFPFGGGPRVCIGAGFAMMEATLLLATIAQRYRFTLAPEAVVAPFFSITLRPKYGLPMQLHRRTDAPKQSATQPYQR
jgi:cytochrome P450